MRYGQPPIPRLRDSGGHMPVEIVATTYQLPDGSQEVELTHNGQTKRFTAEGLSEYIEALAAVRANLLPPVHLATRRRVGEHDHCRSGRN